MEIKSLNDPWKTSSIVHREEYTRFCLLCIILVINVLLYKCITLSIHHIWWKTRTLCIQNRCLLNTRISRGTTRCSLYGKGVEFGTSWGNTFTSRTPQSFLSICSALNILIIIFCIFTIFIFYFWANECKNENYSCMRTWKYCIMKLLIHYLYILFSDASNSQVDGLYVVFYISVSIFILIVFLYKIYCFCEFILHQLL